MTDLEERFWSRVDTSGEHWMWTGTVGDDGYGRIGLGNRSLRAHRVSAELNLVDFDPALMVLHHCDIALCVRPQCLYQGDNAQNMQDKVARGRDNNAERNKTHCKNGHEFTAENTYIRPDKYQRVCRTCVRTWQAQHRARYGT